MSDVMYFVDNVTLQLDGVLYLRVIEPYDVSAGFGSQSKF